LIAGFENKSQAAVRQAINPSKVIRITAIFLKPSFMDLAVWLVVILQG